MMRRAMVLVVLASGTIFAVPGTGVAGGCHSSAGQTTTGRSRSDVLVHIEKCGFAPTVLYVEPGSEITWINDDPVPHTITGTALSLHADKEFYQGKRTEPLRFDDPGVYPYYCILHPGMVGAVVVGDVSADKADARPIQAQPVVVPNSGDPPTAPEPDDASLMPYVLAITILLGALAGGAITRARRRGRGPLGPEERTTVGP